MVAARLQWKSFNRLFSYLLNKSILFKRIAVVGIDWLISLEPR